MYRSIYKTLMILFAFCHTGLLAQDIHFSQFYAVPMNLNPALTGLFKDSYRFSAGHRQQGSGNINGKYVTNYFGVEKNSVINEKDFFGSGLLLLGDKTANAGIHKYGIIGSFSYTKNLEKLFLSTGLQIGYTQKMLKGEFLLPDDPDRFYSPQEIANGNYTPVHQLNINGGILGSFRFNEIHLLYMGISGFYLNQPKESLLNDQKINMKPKTNIHAGLRILTLDERLAIVPHFRMLLMNKANNLLMGSNFEYYFNTQDFQNKDFISLGGWYRLNNAFCINLGLGIKQWFMGVSYDYMHTMSQKGVGTTNAMELHFNYKIRSKSIKLLHNPGLVI